MYKLEGKQINDVAVHEVSAGIACRKTLFQTIVDGHRVTTEFYPVSLDEQGNMLQTTIDGGELRGWVVRAKSYEDALVAHEAMVMRVQMNRETKLCCGS